MTDCVGALARTVRVETSESQGYDWDAVEASLGVRLPSDYKKIADLFPVGLFQGSVHVIRPGDHRSPRDEYPGYYLQRLETMREWRAREPRRFPFPIYPEPGGLLPWGRTRQHGLLFWLTEGDCERWPTVVCSPQFERWGRSSGTACEFLSKLVAGEINGSPLGMKIAPGAPVLRIAQGNSSGLPGGRGYWNAGPNSWGTAPRVKGDYPALQRLLGSGREEPDPVDWAAVHDELGLRLPEDYRLFVRDHGAGSFLDVRIAVPHSPALDLFDLLRRTSQGVRGAVARDVLPPVHPAEAGVVAWGETVDGWTCCWVPIGEPDAWGIGFFAPGYRHFGYNLRLSFSSFLVRYTEQRRSLLLGRPAPVVRRPFFSPA
ncbi:hypothetical protein [Amycolatopsis sp. 3B14]|uniref:hypothetical protein n=1 Tax=Amycolatopsis sp. 3B14 TaxID=3243600 RepID=UPI003D970BDE